MRVHGIGGLIAAGGLSLLASLSGRPAVAGGTGDTKNVDELVAVVEGEFITRRSLMRDVGERNAEEDERTYEMRLRRTLYARAVRRIFVHAGELMGITLTADALEEQVQYRISGILDAARTQAEKDKPGSGSKITIERWLAEKGQTMEEFRSDIFRQVMIWRYYHVLQQGVPGRRAIVDVEATPQDLFRLYAAHKDDLSTKRGIRFAIFGFSPVAFLEQHPKYDAAVTAAKAQAERAIAEFRRDQDPVRVARELGVKKEDWTFIPKGAFLPEDFKAKSLTDRVLAEWAFAPARRPGDATVVEGANGALIAVYLIEIRPAQTRTFDEVKEELAKRVHDVRTERFRGAHLLTLLGRAQIWPTSLAEELEDQQRAALAKLDEDPVNRDIRLK